MTMIEISKKKNIGFRPGCFFTNRKGIRISFRPERNQFFDDKAVWLWTRQSRSMHGPNFKHSELMMFVGFVAIWGEGIFIKALAGNIIYIKIDDHHEPKVLKGDLRKEFRVFRSKGEVKRFLTNKNKKNT